MLFTYQLMRQVFSLFFVALFFVSCKKQEANQESYQTLYAVSYGSDTAQRMDVYLPPDRNTTNTKILILIHGGAWTSGDKTDFDSYIPDFKQRLPNYVIANINYRLAYAPANNLFPTQENDVKAAFNFILTKADEYHFNKEKLAVLGASAGAHLALLQCYKNSSPKVKALVDMFGPTDMVALYNSSDQFSRLAIQSLLSGTPTTNPAIYQSSSPINFVSAQSPPTLILHGGVDPLVPIAQSIALKNKLQSISVPVQMVTYPNEGHGWTGASLTDTYNQIVNFLANNNP